MEPNIKTEKIIVYAGLFLITVFFLYYLYPELKVEHDLNDNFYHYSIAKAMNDQIDEGNNFIDFWLPNYNLGFPLFHYYQFLPSLILNIIYRLFLRNLSLVFLIHASMYLLLSLYPLIIYFSSRKFGFTRMHSLFCAALSLTLSAETLTYGIELGSFVWRGFGLYTQLIGMFLFPLALAYCYDAIINNKNYFKAILLFALTFLSHTLVGVLLVYSLILLVISNFFVDSPSQLNESKKRIIRLLIICIAVFALISFFLIPQMLNSNYRFQSKYFGDQKIFSYGAKIILTKFITGNAFDSGRLPLLTILIFIGIISAFFWHSSIFQ